MERCLRRKKEIGPKAVKLSMCSQMLQVQTSGASADKWQLKANVDKGRKCGENLLVQTSVAYVACSERCGKSRGR